MTTPAATHCLVKSPANQQTGKSETWIWVVWGQGFGYEEVKAILFEDGSVWATKTGWTDLSQLPGVPA